MLEQTDNTTVYSIDQLRSIITPYVQSHKNRPLQNAYGLKSHLGV